ncbi:multifunctional CCA addition/repair protein [Rhodoferax antarcticus]|uniref:Multifunctional CCA protein n=1 Tax=Rhodoferax antarcticus ANT.BR TaxID=1111071 RepID=A0A1Q8YJF8_9BURK|nr:multifunctional CCA addition/repair protein [Rhodoferax antarcticus]APW47623.1 multifunctional CCA tRNA nucleotidyl transferase/2'3'-cyclic phosphodiesterase/2'nucleotidase/phosphatase [Rhodoferax antarcticus]MCW2313801.1 tRNA nucleotidyltransferase (CCA-adding enzyme) [Rhodoferax antarcticus]OLP08123.1 putative Multifunctional CCA protein [Rhodoferax antarcticus ANT.BR]
MKIHLVGGAVRDALLGLPVTDRDWVVVGATPQAMIDQGFLPVGKDFPVFLHPTTHEEYALARTERKTAPGYHGFAVHAAPDVTLEEDLARRDITINAIAANADWTRARGLFCIKNAPSTTSAVTDAAGALIDPFHGQRDLANKVFRHVSPAFREDPVRILRVARFAARFADFSVAPETLALMREMVASGEVDHLVPERVWQELARGLMEATPSRMFSVLRDCGALKRLLPEVDRLWGVPQRADYHPEIDTGVHLMMVLDMSARLGASLPVRFACLGHDLGKGNTPADVLPRHLGHEARSAKLLKPLCERLRVPTDCRELADVMAREHSNIHRSADFSAGALVRLLERCDALRKPQRMADILLACECDARGRLGYPEAAYPPRQRLLSVLQLIQQVDTKEIAASAIVTGASGQKVGEFIHQARVAAVQVSLAG